VALLLGGTPSLRAQSQFTPDSVATNVIARDENADSTNNEATEEAELAIKLQNPVANLVSVPFQNNWDFGIGPARAMRYTVNIQPTLRGSLFREFVGVFHRDAPG
jgi:hypothetical protein